MLKVIKCFLFCLIAHGFSSQVQATDQVDFSPTNWTQGLHLLARTGVSSMWFESDQRENRQLGLGSHLGTELGYFFSRDFAIEWNAQLTFHQLDDFLLWDSLFTFGIRIRVPRLFHQERGPLTNFVRLFAGSGPAVIIFRGKPMPEFTDLDVQRIHLSGPVVGLGLGRFHQTLRGRVWFTEFTATANRLLDGQFVRSQNDVPIVLTHMTIADQSILYTLYFAIGILTF